MVLRLLFLLPIFLFATDTEGKSDTYGVMSDLSDFENDPSSVVGSVNVITGIFIDHDVDITSMGPVPLTWERSNHKGWTDNWVRKADMFHKSKHRYKVDYVGAHGREIELGGYYTKNNDISYLSVNEEVFEYGVTNCTRGVYGGKTHLRNVNGQRSNGTMFISEGDGKKTFFKINLNMDTVEYELEKEVLPDGNFFTIQGKDHNRVVTAHDSKGKALGSITQKDIYPDQWKYRPGFVPIVQTKSDDGHKARYFYSMREIKSPYEKQPLHWWVLDRVERSSGPTITYGNSSSGSLLEKNFPEGRKIVIQEYKQRHTNAVGDIPKVKITQDTNFRNHKVRRVLEPAAKDGGLVPTYQYYYHKGSRRENQAKSKVTVWNAHGKKKVYSHKKMRLESIETYEENTVFSKETFYWVGCNLKKRVLYGANSLDKIQKVFQYDKNHNVVKEEVFGNIRGLENINIAYKMSCYSDDEMNLLLRQFDGDVTTEITYYPGTNLIASEIRTARGGLIKRKFLKYDDAAVKVEEIFDDGTGKEKDDLTGVTERLIRRIETNEKGLPETVSEYYLSEGGEEILLRREFNTFTSMGRLIKQAIFDANDMFVFALEWDYDSHGNITRTTDAEGYSTFRAYDPNDNLIYQKTETEDFHKEWTYDKMNRMIAEKEVHPEKTFSAHTSYDLCGNKENETNWYGNVTIYAYDGHNRRTQAATPFVWTDGETYDRLRTFYTYDLHGNVSSVTDPAGNVTRYKNTIFGKPYHITYPDGSTKSCEYDLHGRIVATVDPYGHRVEITYDGFGRPLTEIQDGMVLKSRVYNTFHLLSETDAAGNTVNYEYNRGGRKIAETSGTKRIEYEYDPLGRVFRTTSNTQIAEVIYNFKNQPVEELLYDKQGTLLSRQAYYYDVVGRKTHTLTYTDDGVEVDEKKYNSLGDVVWHKNTAGEVTTTFYDFDFVNEKGRYVPRQVMTDPTGRRMETIMDATGRVLKIEIVSPFGDLLQRKEFGYDPLGNRAFTKESVVVKGEVESIILNRWEWDKMGRLSAVIEGAGDPDQKTTRYTYTLSGKKESILKPDGKMITLAYDEKDRLKTLSGPGVHYEYEYDIVDNPVEVKDLINGTSTKRVYSLERYLLKEELANGLALSFERDEEGKVIDLQVKDIGSVRYKYKGPRIDTIERCGASGQILYTASYDHYDLSGKVKSMTLPHGTKVDIVYDTAGRIKEILTPLWKQKGIIYDQLGNSTEDVIEDDKGITPREYAYDALSQLTKESGIFQHSWCHDSVNNMVEEDGNSYSYNVLNQPINRDEEYDRNGNMIREGTKHLTYDVLDRLIKVEDQGLESCYSYDDMHRRLTQDNRRFLYFGADEIGSFEGDQLKEFRVLGKGIAAEIGATVAMEVEGESFAPIHDRSGNITALYDLNQELAGKVDYNAFGTFESSGRVVSPWLHSSKRWDSKSRFFYFGRRYYNPRSHRWITADPIKFDGGANLYAYVGNNPLSLIDPYGLSPSNNMSSQEIWGMFFNAVASVPHLIGMVVEGVGAHLVPIPLVRDVIECAGYVMQGNDISDYKMSYSRDHSCSGTFSGKNPGPKQVAYMKINGICTTYNDFMDQVKQFSEDNGGVDVQYVYNGTNGFLCDVLEAGMQKMGIETRPERMAKEKIRQIVDERGGTEADMAILWQAHSQGGLIAGNVVHYLPEEYTSKIHLRTMGSASVVADRRFGSVKNYASTNDFVPMTDPWGYLQGMLGFGRNLTILGTQGAHPIEHPLDSGSYIDAHKIIIREFSKISRNYE